MIRNIDDLLDLEEGNIPYAYRDHLGFWTIARGILIDKRKGGGLRPEESDFINKNRLRAVQREVFLALPWTEALDPVRQAVLVSMAYQMGTNGLLKFGTTLRLIQSGDYESAAEQMLKSKWNRKDTPKRAQRHSKMMRTAQWPEENEYE
jgi:lysozyme